MTQKRSSWRPVGKVGEAYPDWLRALKSVSGVYAIRTRGLFGSRCVYVGESHTGRLQKTIVRHFQNWTRGKGFWVGLFAESSTDPGRTYPRNECEVSVLTCHARDAIAIQNEWILELRPRDNVAGANDDTVPF